MSTEPMKRPWVKVANHDGINVANCSSPKHFIPRQGRETERKAVVIDTSKKRPVVAPIINYDGDTFVCVETLRNGPTPF